MSASSALSRGAAEVMLSQWKKQKHPLSIYCYDKRPSPAQAKVQVRQGERARAAVVGVGERQVEWENERALQRQK